MILFFYIFNFLSAEINVEEYRLNVFVQDRYVRSEVAVHVINNGSGSEEYDFGVKLDENEFISGLTMRVGDKVTHGKVHEKETAQKIYTEARSRGENVALTSQVQSSDSSFNTKVNVPPGQNAFFWLTFEQRLPRSKAKYNYKTNLKTFGKVKSLKLFVKIKESRNLKDPIVSVGNNTLQGNEISAKEVEYSWSTTDADYDDEVKIEYDIVRPTGNGGDILIRNGYFVHFISPDDLEPIPKNIIFVIDKSGSMSGDRIEKTKEAFEFIINDLENIDKFNIVYFDSRAQKLFPESKSSQAGLSDAKEFISLLEADGSTNIDDALKTALSEPPHAESEAGIIFLLSDGETNHGERNWDTIRENAEHKNKKRFAIFTFAIGSSAPFSDLEKLSIQNDGLARQIFTDSDVKNYVEDFYKSVATPLLWNMKIKYGNAKKSIFSSKKLFKGEEIVVVGQLDDPCQAPAPLISGSSAGANFNDVVVVMQDDCKPVDTVTNVTSNQPNVSSDPMENPDGTPSDIDLERMFAYLQIRRWTTEMKGAKKVEKAEEFKQKIIKQSIKHGFVTKFTSMVVKQTEQKSTAPTVQPTTVLKVPIWRYPARPHYQSFSPSRSSGRHHRLMSSINNARIMPQARISSKNRRPHISYNRQSNSFSANRMMMPSFSKNRYYSRYQPSARILGGRIATTSMYTSTTTRTTTTTTTTTATTTFTTSTTTTTTTTRTLAINIFEKFYNAVSTNTEILLSATDRFHIKDGSRFWGITGCRNVTQDVQLFRTPVRFGFSASGGWYLTFFADDQPGCSNNFVYATISAASGNRLELQIKNVTVGYIDGIFAV